MKPITTLLLIFFSIQLLAQSVENIDFKISAFAPDSGEIPVNLSGPTATVDRLFFRGDGELWTYIGNPNSAISLGVPVVSSIPEATTETHVVFKQDFNTSYVITDGTIEGTSTFFKGENTFQRITSSIVAFDGAFYFTESIAVSEQSSQLSLIRIDPHNGETDTIAEFAQLKMDNISNALEIAATSQRIAFTSPVLRDGSSIRFGPVYFSDGTREGTSASWRFPRASGPRSSSDRVLHSFGNYLFVTDSEQGYQNLYIGDGDLSDFYLLNKTEIRPDLVAMYEVNNRLIVHEWLSLYSIPSELAEIQDTIQIQPEVQVVLLANNQEIIYRGLNHTLYRNNGTTEESDSLFSAGNITSSSGVFIDYKYYYNSGSDLISYDLNTRTVDTLKISSFQFTAYGQPINHQGDLHFIASNNANEINIYAIDFNLEQSTTGLTYHDANHNNQPDTEEAVISGIPVTANSNTSRTVFSDQTGQFSHYLRPDDAYTVSAQPNRCWELSSTPESYSITAERDTIYTLNFGFQPIDGAASIRSVLSIARPRCGFTIPAWITLYNDGCEDLEHTFADITLPEGVTLISADLPPNISGNILSWEPGSLLTGESHVIRLELQMPGEEANGEDIIINLHGAGIYDLDLFVESDHLFNQPLSCAIDPNDKRVTPSRIEPSNSNYTQNDETLTYTIRFQNTGTDTAFNVRLEDQLSSQLDHLTFKPIAASHDYRASMDENGLVRVFFDNILLPDSTVNQPLSHGFFTFDVNTLPELEDFTAINNTAGIYFDFNQPIITNTVTSTIVEFIDEDEDGFPFYEECDDKNPNINPDRYDIPGNGIDEDCNDVDTPVSTTSPLSGQLSVFPNPAHQQLSLAFSDNRELTAQLYDLLGREHAKLVFRSNASLPLTNLPAGTYLLKVTDVAKGETNIQRVIRR